MRRTDLSASVMPQSMAPANSLVAANRAPARSRRWMASRSLGLNVRPEEDCSKVMSSDGAEENSGWGPGSLGFIFDQLGMR